MQVESSKLDPTLNLEKGKFMQNIVGCPKAKVKTKAAKNKADLKNVDERKEKQGPSVGTQEGAAQSEMSDEEEGEADCKG